MWSLVLWCWRSKIPQTDDVVNDCDAWWQTWHFWQFVNLRICESKSGSFGHNLITSSGKRVLPRCNLTDGAYLLSNCSHNANVDTFRMKLFLGDSCWPPLRNFTLLKGTLQKNYKRMNATSKMSLNTKYDRRLVLPSGARSAPPIDGFDRCDQYHGTYPSRRNGSRKIYVATL